MGLARLVTRRRGTSVVLLGAVVSLGVVAMTASRFSWRRTKAEPAPEPQPQSTDTPEATTPRWDTPPIALEPPYVKASETPPSPEV
jgi:uncharacterized membrane protein YebE (DUF533 family)